jgi:hypothetical protein
MRKPMPLRWIEEAEARQVLTTAQCEAPEPPLAPVAPRAPWSRRVRRWVAAAPSSPNPEANAEANADVAAAVTPWRREGPI